MDTTQGTLLGGRLRYAQPAQGYRTGIEPVLLAASIPARPGERVLEAGTGAGAALLCLCHRVPGLVAVGIERDPAMAGLARRNASDNHAPCTVLTADITAPADLPPFDHVLANPPWHDPASTRPARPRVDAAKHRAPGGLDGWIEALVRHMRPGATITLILPACHAAPAMAALHARRLARMTLVPLWPRAGRPAKLILLQARRGGGPTRIAPGLVLHADGPGYTPQADAILRDGAPLPDTHDTARKPRPAPPLEPHTTENPPMSDNPDAFDGSGGRHQAARTIAEQAIRAQAEGDDDQAEALFAQAARIDPDAVANALSDAAANPVDSATGTDAAPQDDDEIAAMSRTVQPRADAPSRSGVSGRGSGADTEGS